MYAAAIAAGIVRFNSRVSRQSDRAVKRGLTSLLDDRGMPMPLRDLAGSALNILKQETEEHEPPTMNGDDTLPMADDDDET
jgi:hypothetical protein